MKRILLLIAILSMTACSGGCAELSAARSAAAKHGADAADQTLETAIWTMCSAIPVGAVKRRFKTPEEKTAYNALCPAEQLP